MLVFQWIIKCSSSIFWVLPLDSSLTLYLHVVTCHTVVRLPTKYIRSLERFFLLSQVLATELRCERTAVASVGGLRSGRLSAYARGTTRASEPNALYARSRWHFWFYRDCGGNSLYHSRWPQQCRSIYFINLLIHWCIPLFRCNTYASCAICKAPVDYN